MFDIVTITETSKNLTRERPTRDLACHVSGIDSRSIDIKIRTAGISSVT